LASLGFTEAAEQAGWERSGAIACFVLLVFAAIVLASIVKVWPYNFEPTLRHYNFNAVGGGGYAAYWNSIRMSLYTAIFGTAAVFAIAYLVEKGKGLKGLRLVNYFLATIPLALPGLVLGLADVFFFNNPTWNIGGLAIRNPLNWLYLLYWCLTRGLQTRTQAWRSQAR
jgi:iron(III) transport system permease protein